MLNYDVQIVRSQQTREIIKALRKDIILGQYPKGSRLIEAKIAEKLGVSRAPIRSVFQMLEQEGLLRSLSNGGTEVVGFSIKQAEDLFDLRFLLESKALELVFANSSFVYRPLFENMELLETYMKKAEITEIPVEETSMLDIQFHRSLLQMAENRPMLVAWETMVNIFQLLLEITNMTSSSYKKFFVEHKMLAEMIIRREIKESLRELEFHISNAKEIIISRLENKLVT
jgi:DNA-binding GntR family transcriptional regulator